MKKKKSYKRIEEKDIEIKKLRMRKKTEQYESFRGDIKVFPVKRTSIVAGVRHGQINNGEVEGNRRIVF